MKKRVCFTALLLLAGAIFVYAGQKGSENIMIDGGRLGNVTLPHWQHQKALSDDCNACHKLFPKEKQSISRMKESASLQKKAVMNNCIACHKELIAQSKTAGPVNCKGCHKK